MKEIDIQELQMNAPRVVASVEVGESITITDKGTPVALLRPIRPSRIDALIEVGATTPPSRRLVDLPPPAPRASDQSPLSEIVEEQRADRIWTQDLLSLDGVGADGPRDEGQRGSLSTDLVG